MECVYVVEAKHIKDFTVYLKFNTGESGHTDLKDLIHHYSQAASLRDPGQFKNFFP
ncbi:MAG: DUF2442 domain-containing protein [Desulfobacterium sp.]|jgi:hypothetical protein|nr:DUF2442 domain-containing protein [Desulfobacterium sp.]